VKKFAEESPLAPPGKRRSWRIWLVVAAVALGAILWWMCRPVDSPELRILQKYHPKALASNSSVSLLVGSSNASAALADLDKELKLRGWKVKQELSPAVKVYELGGRHVTVLLNSRGEQLSLGPYVIGPGELLIEADPPRNWFSRLIERLRL
jgi:hypothetical protein